MISFYSRSTTFVNEVLFGFSCFFFLPILIGHAKSVCAVVGRIS